MTGAHTLGLTCLCPLENGWIASGSPDRTIHVWNPNAMKWEFELNPQHAGTVTCLLAMKGGIFCSGSADETIMIWKLQ